MTTHNDQARVCPTRVDRTPALFTHRVGEGLCQSRQRAQYHKCYTCAYSNDYVRVHGMPEPPRVRIHGEAPVAETPAVAGLPEVHEVRQVPELIDKQVKAV